MSTSWPRRDWRLNRFPIRDPVRHTCDLSVSREVSGKGAGSVFFLSVHAQALSRASSRVSLPKTQLAAHLRSERYSMSVAPRITPRVAGVLPEETRLRIANERKACCILTWEVFVDQAALRV